MPDVEGFQKMFQTNWKDKYGTWDKNAVVSRKVENFTISE